MRTRRTLLTLGALVVLVSGCVDGGNGRGAETVRACSPGGDAVEVGSSFADGVPTRFTVTTSTYEFTADGFLHDGPFDPKVGRTAVSLGPADVTPTYNPQSGQLTGATVAFVVAEDLSTVVDLTAGTYWVLNSSGVVIRARACGEGTVTPE